MSTPDDGLHEIQLNGKQIVFLFMVGTVVSVVIFLCGVLVGRGVQGRSTPVEAAPAASAEAAELPASVEPPSGPTKAEGLGYNDRLESPGPVPERLLTPAEAARKAAAAPPATPPAPASGGTSTAAAPVQAPSGAAAAKPAPAPPATKPVAELPVPAEPRGDGFAIQVAALRGRAEADGVVARLKAKGYAAYLLPSQSGQPVGFRVRVGKFKTRPEAEQVAARLEREEQFKPWITR